MLIQLESMRILLIISLTTLPVWSVLSCSQCSLLRVKKQVLPVGAVVLSSAALAPTFFLSCGFVKAIV